MQRVQSLHGASRQRNTMLLACRSAWPVAARPPRLRPPASASAEGGVNASTEPAAATSAAARLEALRAERDAAKARLEAADIALRAALADAVQQATAAPPQRASSPSTAAAAVAATATQPPSSIYRQPPPSATLDNFGFIRQHSGDPYNSAAAGQAGEGAWGVPGGLIEMGAENFLREGREMLAAMGVRVPALRRGEVGAAPLVVTPEVLQRQAALKRLTLSNKAIWDREHARPPIRAPWVIKGPYLLLCVLLDVLFDGRPIARFWLLETVARMPYFSYVTALHLYESLGFWRRWVRYDVGGRRWLWVSRPRQAGERGSARWRLKLSPSLQPTWRRRLCTWWWRGGAYRSRHCAAVRAQPC